MLSGTLIAESLRTGGELEVNDLRLRSIARRDVSGGVTPEQPGIWTLIDFEAPDDQAAARADALAAVLAHDGGWYADFRVAGDHVVVFSGRVFRYRRGDPAGRAEAARYGRSLGVPEHQLDWEE